MNDRFLKNLRDALNNLYNPDQLRSNPLTVVFGINERHDTPIAMQKVLENLIQALKPKPGDAPRSQKRRAYDLLYSRYIDQFSQKEVADQLGVSLRTYQREQQTALDLLSALIVEKYPIKPTEDRVGLAAAAIDSSLDLLPNHNDSEIDEFAWMFEPNAERAVELERVLDRLQVFIQPLVIRYSVIIQNEIEPGLPVIAVNPEALLQILVNLFTVLLHQAVQGTVQLSARLRNGSIVIDLFSPYSQGVSETSEADQAGLAIVQRLVQLSQGTFTYSPSQHAILTQVQLPVLEALPILVIDDSMDNIKLIQRYLSGTRYHTIGLNQPEQALDVIEKIQPQAVILDLMMPQVDGLEILTRLRTQSSAFLVPIIVCTILPQEELALSLGASAFLGKPIHREDLLRVLDQLVLAQGRESDPPIG